MYRCLIEYNLLHHPLLFHRFRQSIYLCSPEKQRFPCSPGKKRYSKDTPVQQTLLRRCCIAIIPLQISLSFYPVSILLILIGGINILSLSPNLFFFYPFPSMVSFHSIPFLPTLSFVLSRLHLINSYTWDEYLDCPQQEKHQNSTELILKLLWHDLLLSLWEEETANVFPVQRIISWV